MFKKLFVVLFVLSILISGALADSNKKPIRFAILGDRTGGAVEHVYEGIVSEIELLKPDFVMTVGDMIEGPESDSVKLVAKWDEYFKIVSEFSMPIHYTPGNNDIETDIMLTMYKHYLGNPYYSFDYENIHITVLDNSRWTASKSYPKEQIDWFIEDMKKSQDAKYRLVFIHKPFWYRTIGVGDEDGLHELFKKHNVDAVFCGHFHKYFSGEYDGIKYTTIGSSGGGYHETPWSLGFQFAYVTVSDDDITIAPIKSGTVQTWDVITTDNIFQSEKSRLKGINFANHLFVADDLTAPESDLQVIVKNFNKVDAIRDTLSWEIPDGWSISPNMIPLNIEPHTEQKINFKISSQGNLYPVPTISTKVPYSDEIAQPITKELSVARRIDCYKTTQAPKIDGHIDEVAWKSPQNLFFNYDMSIAGDDSTLFYFAYDDEYLYLAAYCHESNMDSLKSEITELDKPVYTDDCVGFMFETKENSATAYQIYVNPNGAIYDQIIKSGYDGYYESDKSWNGEYEVKAFKGADFWSVELKIPMKTLDADTQEGSQWRTNFRRKHQRTNSASMWQLPWGYNPSYYGYLYLR